ncbi:dapF [Wigglesworthia glossinidia endosymbiont of Glossina brevipalpis]|uniref:Diaminopimelate epimerase n=1 Tax=Wigglesworthia glossinidia brevipalpis TaxID=36870 RepID=DAPF_WIGBR|nr:RecName: Full=Diaminopimelate epimerase; Short=DAP epimerase; AltName: Full=PLP-independent amino acid racemase [Wigglesworthia glossinidia endosymbiont of Glossina brevipalpis]BAC24416.1 dapF [Wigglesworthia glossinidia endosymbiont of Glossina brevipalpis]
MKFSKMHSLGNDFVIVNNIDKKNNISPIFIKKLSDRYTGIGFDQLILIEFFCKKYFYFKIKIFNSDSSESFQCINGIRCVFMFLKIKKLIKKNIAFIGNNLGLSKTLMTKNKLICVKIKPPRFYIEKDILVNPKYNNKEKIILRIFKKKITCYFVFVGNPHCIIISKNIEYNNFSLLSKYLLKNNIFPNKINISIMNILDFDLIKLKVYERGSGETQSCGSAAAAAAAVAIYYKKLNKKIKVNFSRGNLYVYWEKIGNFMSIIGPANHIYDGKINF